MSFETISSFKGREMRQRGRPDENAAKKGKREELKKKEMKEKEIKVSKKKEKAEKKSKGASKKAKTKKSERLVIVETFPGQPIVSASDLQNLSTFLTPSPPHPKEHTTFCLSHN